MVYSIWERTWNMASWEWKYITTTGSRTTLATSPLSKGSRPLQNTKRQKIPHMSTRQYHVAHLSFLFPLFFFLFQLFDLILTDIWDVYVREYFFFGACRLSYQDITRLSYQDITYETYLDIDNRAKYRQQGHTLKIWNKRFLHYLALSYYYHLMQLLLLITF